MVTNVASIIRLSVVRLPGKLRSMIQPRRNSRAPTTACALHSNGMVASPANTAMNSSAPYG